METLSSLDESSSSDTKSNSTFQLPPQSTTSAMKPPPKAEVRILCRMGSGTTSVVIDADASGSEADSRTNILTTNINFNNNNHKLPSSKYKGVVPQPNGRWGAQIYDKHQRVWLGTFDKEAEDAHVYDVAVHRYRGGDGVTNFNPLSDPEELQFLASRSKAEVVDILRKHTYHDELLDSRRNTAVHQSREVKGKPNKAFRRALFEKVVTPSDVGKLNRLVIPKQQAERHFPRTACGQKGKLACSPKGLLLSFEDGRTDKVWRFRYSYWNSSRSYVLTRGWSRFVKEHSLKAGDTVSFQRSTIPHNTHQLYIQCRTAARNTAAAVVLQSQGVPGKMLRLFGVDICAGHAIQH